MSERQTWQLRRNRELSSGFQYHSGVVSQRLGSVDGLRGLLAVAVVADHLCGFIGNWDILGKVAQAAVWCFFVMSGLVLTRAYDNDYPRFVVKRFVRLWPLFAVCMVAGSLITGRLPDVSSLFYWPVGSPPSLPIGAMPNPPSWSLYIELWAAFFMPAIAWFGGPGPIRKAAILPVWLLLVIADERFGWAIFFMVGAALSRWHFSSPILEARVTQWLGKVSFSLYLSHWPVLMLCRTCFGYWGVVPAVPAALVVAWVLWRFVERPTIVLSRRFDKLRIAASVTTA